MSSLSASLADNIFSISLVFLPIVCGWIYARYANKNRFDCIFLSYIFVGVGIQGFASGITQSFYSNVVTEYVHWPFSPFIIELGLANISYGILGFLSPWMNRGWQTATAFGYSLFLLFTGMRHALEVHSQGTNPGNSGIFAYEDYAMSCILLILLAIRQLRESSLATYRREENRDMRGGLKTVRVALKSSTKYINL